MKLVFVETSDIGAQYLRKAAEFLGFKPQFVFREGNYQAETLDQLKASYHVLADTRSEAEVLKALSYGEKPVGMMSILDMYIPVAQSVGKKLGAETANEGVIRSKDKGLVAKVLGDFSPLTIELSLKQPASEWAVKLSELWKKSPNGILLKMRYGAGALGLHFVDTEAGLSTIRETLIKDGIAEEWLAQSRVEGDLISCEGFWEKGKATAWGFTGRGKVGKTESRCYFPDDAKVSAAARARVDGALSKLFTEIGIESSYFHSEFIVSKETAYLIDANLGRIAGASVGEMIALSYDFDTVLLYAHYLLTTLPKLKDLSPAKAKEVEEQISAVLQKKRRDTIALFYGAPIECELKKLLLPESFKSGHIQLLSEGGTVPAMGTNNWDWIGLLTGFPDDVWEDYRRIRLETNKGILTPIC